MQATDSRLDFVPLSSLSYDPAINARGTAQTDLGPIAATIREKGLGQPLLVRPAGDGRHYEPVDGGGRFHALRLLRDEGAIAPDHPVPVMIRDLTDAEALEMSLMTTVTRRELNPGREAQSFARLAREGRSVAELALHFGVSERLVKGRLALAALPEEILTALIGSRLSLEAAQAYTIGRDAGQQIKAYREAGDNAHYARNLLTQKRIGADAPEARFVGVEAYRAAGGEVSEDLFTTAAWLSDGKLLARLCAEKLKAETARLTAEGWAFVLAKTSSDPGPDTYAWHQLTPEGKRSLDADAKERLADLRARKKGLDKRDARDELSPDEQQHLCDLNEEIESIEAQPFTPEQMANSGVIIDLRYSSLDLYTFGIMRPAQARKEKARLSKQTAADRPQASGRRDREEEADFTGALNTEMAKAMTAAMQAAIIARPDHAAALAAAVLLATCGVSSPALPFHVASQDRFTAPAKETAKTLDAVKKRLAGKDSVAEIFAAIQAGTVKASDVAAASLAALFALDANVPPGVQPLTEAFDPDVSAVWHLGEEFFKRMPRESLAAALGEAAIPEVTPSKKKRELVEMALRDLVPLGWLPKPLRTPCYKGPGSNAFSEAHAAMTAEQIAARHAASPPKSAAKQAKPKAARKAGHAKTGAKTMAKGRKR